MFQAHGKNYFTIYNSIFNTKPIVCIWKLKPQLTSSLLHISIHSHVLPFNEQCIIHLVSSGPFFYWTFKLLHVQLQIFYYLHNSVLTFRVRQNLQNYAIRLKHLVRFSSRILKIGVGSPDCMDLGGDPSK